MKIETPPQDAAATLNVDDAPLTTILDLLHARAVTNPIPSSPGCPPSTWTASPPPPSAKGRTAWTWPAAWWTAPPNC
ncbi:hypothetical protein [Pseudoxanthomonas japonensis]|uniref:hypothetical protein n=1 Tax=Pseudoxanthomonas japonensis TaxID=69284 RepID=UPI003749A152